MDEKWQNSTGTDIAHYKYVYDGKGNIVRSIDFSGKKEYNYEYEDGRIVRATESNITVTNEIVTSKVIVNTIKYYLADRFVFKHKAGPVTHLWGIMATPKIAVTLDNCSKKWYNMSQGDEKMGKMLHNAGQKATAERRGQTIHITPQA